MSYIWLPVDVNLVSNHKVKRLVRRLQLRSSAEAMGYLIALWSWAMVHAPDGDLSHLDTEDIASAAGWPEDADAFTEALSQAGWLDQMGAGLAVHDWEEHQGSSFRARLNEAARKREQRAHKRDTCGTSVGQEWDIDGTRLTDQTGPDRTRQERKDRAREKPAAALASLPGYEARPDDDAWLDEVSADYPGVDVVLEIHACRDWWAGRNSKAKANWRSRIRNWLKKAKPTVQTSGQDDTYDGIEWAQPKEWDT